MTENMGLQQAAEAIRAARSLLICAGAGMGVDSGLPDFRGDQGFWKAYPPFARQGYRFIDLANPRWFYANPRLAWGFYGHRLNLYRNTVPHDGFRILLEWARRRDSDYFVFTSNVDGQFQKAGFPEDHVLECHGSIHFTQCSLPCRDEIRDAGAEAVRVDETTILAEPPLPVCPYCNRIARPNILMFGDGEWISGRTDRQNDLFSRWMSSCALPLAVIECGAGSAVPTVRYASESMVVRKNARLIRINVREPHVPRGQIGLPLSALEALTAIRRLLEG